MALLPLAFEPGVSRKNTELQAGFAGRLWDASYARAHGDQFGPIGGWSTRSSATVTGKARAMLAWNADNGEHHIVIATHSNLFTQTTSGANFDITPTGFTSGRADSLSGTGFGGGSFGTGGFGIPRPDIGVTSRATVWSLDTYGQDLVGVSPDDGVPYVWELDVGTAATAIPNAPTGCSSLCVTAENSLMVFGANGNGRNVAWSDLRDFTTWTSAATNQAGDFDLPTKGEILKGLRLEGAVLILTNFDAWRAQYADAVYVYGFEPAGHGFGVVGPGAAVAVGPGAYWWSDAGFVQYDGQQARLIECDLFDIIKTDVNMAQAAKITASHNTEWGEIVWDYPSASSTENDRSIRYNYLTGKWWLDHDITRLCRCEKGPFKYPMAMGNDGKVYEHEKTGAPWGGNQPYIETGLIGSPVGGRTIDVNGIIGDEKTFGGVEVGFFTKDYPNADEQTIDATALDDSGYTEFRFNAALFRMRVTFTAAADRWGVPQLDYEPAGKR